MSAEDWDARQAEILERVLATGDRARHDLLQLILVGNLGRDPELRYTQNGAVYRQLPIDAPPFVLPEDDYSCVIVKAVPNGLADFLDSIAHAGESARQ